LYTPGHEERGGCDEQGIGPFPPHAFERGVDLIAGVGLEDLNLQPYRHRRLLRARRERPRRDAADKRDERAASHVSPSGRGSYPTTSLSNSGVVHHNKIGCLRAG
jgi:hypothetical protein